MSIVKAGDTYIASIYGIKRNGFLTELDALRWISNVCGKSIPAMRKKETQKFLTKKRTHVA